VIRLVGEQPGITVPGLSERLKISRPDLYRVTTALTKQGRLRGDGPKLYPAEARAAAPEATAPARAQSQRGPRRTGALAGESAPSNRERRG
jgi:DNA-binding IclR family transcriptional regulator